MSNLQDSAPTESQNQLARFFIYLESERKYSIHTLSAYRRDLQAFSQFCQEQDKTSWSDINEALIRQFVSTQHRKGLSGRSLQRRLSAVRSLFNYLCRHHGLAGNPAEGVPAPKSPKRLPETLGVDQLNNLLTSSDDEPLVCRDHAMLELLYGCGLRLSELTGLDLSDIDWQQQIISVTGKGNKQRRLPFGEKAASALKVWLKARAELSKQDEAALFLSNKGQRISNRSVQMRLKQWALKKGLDSNAYPHMFRHSFASHILESSSDLRAVQELLGHANLSTTQIYTHLDFQHLAGVYDKAHPRSRK